MDVHSLSSIQCNDYKRSEQKHIEEISNSWSQAQARMKLFEQFVSGYACSCHVPLYCILQLHLYLYYTMIQHHS